MSAGFPLEERMACGVGACLACVCQSKEMDGHSHVHNKRICKDGPVFRGRGGGAVMNTKVNLAGVELKNPVMTGFRHLRLRYGIQRNLWI